MLIQFRFFVDLCNPYKYHKVPSQSNNKKYYVQTTKKSVLYDCNPDWNDAIFIAISFLLYLLFFFLSFFVFTAAVDFFFFFVVVVVVVFIVVYILLRVIVGRSVGWLYVQCEVFLLLFFSWIELKRASTHTHTDSTRVMIFPPFSIFFFRFIFFGRN